MEQNTQAPSSEVVSQESASQESAQPKENTNLESVVKDVVKNVEKKQDAPADLDMTAKVKIKINGVEKTVSLKDAITLAQRGAAADEKFREAAKHRKEMDDLISSVRDDPRKLGTLIKALTGKEPEQVYESELSRVLEELTLDPKEKQLREYKKKLEEFERREKAENERKEQEKFAAAQAQWEQKYDKQISDAIKSSGLPLNEDTIQYTADIMLKQLEIDPDNDPPMDIVMDMVRDRYVTQLGKMAKSIDAEKLLELLGDDGYENLAKAAKGKKKSPVSINAEKQVISDSESSKETKSSWKSRDEFERRLEEWKKS